jgi:hypothetical protein
LAPPVAMPAAVRPSEASRNQGIAQIAAIWQSHIGINSLVVLVELNCRDMGLTHVRNPTPAAVGRCSAGGCCGQRGESQVVPMAPWRVR